MKKLILRTGALALLVVLLGTALLVSAEQPNAQASPTLESGRWILASYLDASGKTAEALAGSEPTAEFKAGRVSGSAGCNTYSASYEAKNGTLKIGMAVSTMMMCEQALMEQEQAYLKNLQAAASYKIAGDLLTISDAKGAVLLTFQAEKPGTLTGVTWLMTSYNNGKGGFQSALADVQVTAVFSEEGKLTGNGGCNTYNASYTVDGDKIDIGPAATTRMMCSQPIMEQETAYLKALESAATFKIEGSKLTLRDAQDAAMAAFVQQAPAAEPSAQATSKPAAASTAPSQTKLETTYVTILPAADASMRSLALNLNPDGSAKFATDFGTEKSVIQTGAWKDNGDETLTVTLTDQDGQKLAKPAVMKFQRDGTYLNLVDFDKAVWGENGLKLNLAADVVRKVRSAMVTMDLAAGFPLDPTFVSLNGGGEVDARLLGKECAGYINRQPVAKVHWSGEADMVRAFFYSDGDPTLVILTPDGKLLCNDNANEQLLDPFVEITKPVAGEYRIWVGSAAKNQLIPGVLVLTTKPGVDLGTFELGKLIKRPSIPQTLAKPADGGDARRSGAGAH